MKDPWIKRIVITGTASFVAAVVGVTAQQRVGAVAPATAGQRDARSVRAVLDEYCVSCHSTRTKAGGLVLEGADASHPAANAEALELVIARLRHRSMPPPGLPRPDDAGYEAVIATLERQLDEAWRASPRIGRVSPVHRLNRVEYNNAIRDLFALDVDVTPLLPADETADGSFDNFGDVLSISTAHLDRYMSVARQVTRLATGLPPSNATT
jgi:mono/diheme cytochrome c family protein